MPGLPQVNGARVIRALQRAGFEVVRIGTSTAQDTVNGALRAVMSNRRRAIALARLRAAAVDGAFDLGLLNDKKDYRR